MNNTVHDTKPQVRRPQDRRAKDKGRQVAQAHRLPVPDAVLDDGVLAVHDVDVLGVVTPRNPGDPGLGDVRAGDGVPPAGFLLVGDAYLELPCQPGP